MSLLKQWDETASKERDEKEYNEFWDEYLGKETKIYKGLLAENNNKIKGKFSGLAEKFGMSTLDFMGFMEGIHTSLIDPPDLEQITEDSEIDLTIDFEKLYYNMHEAKADWLYNLPEWDVVLSMEKRKEIKTAYNRSKIVVNENKVGRNDPCPCGSGKKYKKCCGK